MSSADSLPRAGLDTQSLESDFEFQSRSEIRFSRVNRTMHRRSFASTTRGRKPGAYDVEGPSVEREEVAGSIELLTGMKPMLLPGAWLQFMPTLTLLSSSHS